MVVECDRYEEDRRQLVEGITVIIVMKLVKA